MVMTEKVKEKDGPSKALDSKPAQPPLNAKEELADLLRTAAFALLLAFCIRSMFYEPFNIPSGSMKPTLEIGDYIFTNKGAYGYGQYSFSLLFGLHMPVPFEGRIFAKEPQRGDIAVFWLPNLRLNYIKRIVALPGETVQVRRGRLYINGEIVPREPLGLRKVYDAQLGMTTMVEYLETLPGGVVHRIYEETDDEPLDDTEVFTVPDGHYFMMGDNRDNSQDSRVFHMVGPVPFENIVGRSDFIFFSTNGAARVHEFWKWPKSIRYDRFFKSLIPVQPSDEG